ncbi:MAG: zf-HC2 domain-containing protein [Nitrosomonas sp.]|nr:zf-HC2 domain-containing protein [Nitrosomonas sp.]MBP6075543.1 zf-HC2 domain-containing protein [Nitrosomonas sp.]
MLSSNIKILSNSEHQKVWDLLPWYVNYSLDPAEQDIVKKHIKTCVTCRIELNQQQQVFEKMQQTDLLQQVSQVSFAQLKKRIEEQPGPYVLAKHSEPKRQLKFFSHQFLSFVKYTALAASLLLLALPFMMDSLIDKPELTGDYRTLANSIESEQRNNFIRIIFADQSNPEQIEAILNSVSGHIVKGPSQNGVYEVQIGNQQTDSQEVKDAISHLRKNTSVIFAELAYGLPASD